MASHWSAGSSHTKCQTALRRAELSAASSADEIQTDGVCGPTDTRVEALIDSSDITARVKSFPSDALQGERFRRLT